MIPLMTYIFIATFISTLLVVLLAVCSVVNYHNNVLHMPSIINLFSFLLCLQLPYTKVQPF